MSVSIVEKWMAVEGYPNYEVSNTGRVINIQHARELTPRPSDRGYMRVVLCNKGVNREFYVHKLVAQAFLNFPLEDQVIQYDGDLSNNAVNNLYLRKRVAKQIRARPLEREEGAEFTRQWGRKVRIIETGEIFRTVRDCAEWINGDYSCIYAVLRGDREQHRGFTYEYL